MKDKRFIQSALIVPKLNPKKFPPERLFHWLAAPRIPVLVSDDPLVGHVCSGDADGRTNRSHLHRRLHAWSAPKNQCLTRIPTHHGRKW
jgi:hypothetical protein